MPSPSSLCANCGGSLHRPEYQKLASDVVDDASKKMAVTLLDAADEISHQTGMSSVLVIEHMLSRLEDDAVALYLKHPGEIDR